MGILHKTKIKKKKKQSQQILPLSLTMSRKHSIISRHKLKFGGARTKKKENQKKKKKKKGGAKKLQKTNLNYVDAFPYGKRALPNFSKNINRGVREYNPSILYIPRQTKHC